MTTRRTPKTPRRHGTGSLSWHASRGAWRARTAPIEGNVVTKLFRPANRSAAAIRAAEIEGHAWLDSYNVDLARGTITGRQIERASMTVDAWAHEWLERFAERVTAGEKARRTLESYQGDLRRYVLPMLGHVRLRDLSSEHVERWLTRLAATPSRKGGVLSDATRVRAYATLHKIMTDARLGRNPCDEIEPPTIREDGRRQLATWEPNQTNMFVEHTATCERSGGTRLYPLWLLAGRAGLRRGELLGLRWRDVDLAAGLIHVRVAIGVDNGELYLVPRPKGRKSRTVDIDPTVVIALERWAETQSLERSYAGESWNPDPRFPGLVFTNPTGGPVNPTSLSRWFAQHIKHLDGALPYSTLHHLRHSFGSALLAAGVPVGDVARRLGHSQAVLERIYAKELAVLRDESRAVVLDAIERLWGSG